MRIRKFSSCLAILGLVTALFVGTGVGQVVIDQPPNGVNGFFADAGFPQFIAENFVSTGGGLLNYDVTFYGGYFPNDPLPADAFTINLYSDTAGLPGGSAILLASGAADSRTATGTVLFGVQEYVYTMNLGDLDLIPGTYWLEITNNPGLAPGDVWFWETGDLDPVNGIDNGAFSTNGTTWNPLGAGNNLAFTINTTPAGGGGCNNPLGDINGDGIVSLLDVNPFVALLTSGAFQCEADINEDGIVSLLDVNPFVALLSGG